MTFFVTGLGPERVKGTPPPPAELKEMLTRSHILWLLAVLLLIATAAKWWPAGWGDVPVRGVAWTRIGFYSSGPPQELALTDYAEQAKLQDVQGFLESLSSGWKDSSQGTHPAAAAMNHLLLTSTRRSLRIDLVVWESGCVMWYKKDQQRLWRALSRDETSQLLDLFNLTWSKEKSEVVRRP